MSCGEVAPNGRGRATQKSEARPVGEACPNPNSRAEGQQRGLDVSHERESRTAEFRAAVALEALKGAKTEVEDIGR